LERAITYLSDAHAVALLPQSSSLTTRAAAALLGMSRTYLVRQLVHGQIQPYKVGMSTVGTHRRFDLTRVLQFRAQLTSEDEKGADNLQAIGELLEDK
jgi:excisionase family DNA binding protein